MRGKVVSGVGFERQLNRYLSLLWQDRHELLLQYPQLQQNA